MAIGYAGELPKKRASQWEEISYMTTPAKRRERTHQRMVKNLPPFISMSGGINKNIYNPNAPAKVRERKQNQKAKRRRRYAYRGTESRNPPRHTPGGTAMPEYGGAGPINLLDT